MTPRGFGAPVPLLLALAWVLAACGAAPPRAALATASLDPSAAPGPVATLPAVPAATASTGATDLPSPTPAGAGLTPATPGATPDASPTAPTTVNGGLAPIGPTEAAVVLRVVDGDTIVVDRGNGPERLRYIGVDTPETVDPRRPVEWMGREASAANAELVDGREVVLETDISDRDRYDRLLRYVWLREGSAWTLVNLELVRLGFAQVVTYPPDVRYVDLYLAAQTEAREAGRGLWGPETEAPASSGDAADSRPGCDAAYPTVCIAPPPPDLDCGDIPHRRFEVVPPDPHRFDGNGDGVGCERD